LLHSSSLFCEQLKTSLIDVELVAFAIVHENCEELNNGGMLFGAFDRAMKAYVAILSALQVCHTAFLPVCKFRDCVTASEGMKHRKGLGFSRTQRLGK